MNDPLDIIAAELEQAIADTTAEHPIDPFTVAVNLRRLLEQVRSIREGLL